MKMGLLSPNFEAEFRARSAVPGLTLIRKKCGRCAVVITSAQHKRSGKCVKCVIATAFVVIADSANNLQMLFEQAQKMGENA